MVPNSLNYPVTQITIARSDSYIGDVQKKKNNTHVVDSSLIKGNEKAQEGDTNARGHVSRPSEQHQYTVSL